MPSTAVLEFYSPVNKEDIKALLFQSLQSESPVKIDWGKQSISLPSKYIIWKVLSAKKKNKAGKREGIGG